MASRVLEYTPEHFKLTHDRKKNRSNTARFYNAMNLLSNAANVDYTNGVMERALVAAVDVHVRRSAFLKTEKAALITALAEDRSHAADIIQRIEAKVDALRAFAEPRIDMTVFSGTLDKDPEVALKCRNFLSGDAELCRHPFVIGEPKDHSVALQYVMDGTRDGDAPECTLSLPSTGPLYHSSAMALVDHPGKALELARALGTEDAPVNMTALFCILVDSLKLTDEAAMLDVILHESKVTDMQFRDIIGILLEGWRDTEAAKTKAIASIS
jgi:hypothetical protein